MCNHRLVVSVSRGFPIRLFSSVTDCASWKDKRWDGRREIASQALLQEHCS